MRIFTSFCATLALTLAANSPAFAGDNTHSGQAIQHSGKANANTSGSAAHSVAASGQVTSAASAIPMAISGVALSAGAAVSLGAAQGSLKAAKAPIGAPLKITDEAITTTPPNEALKTKGEKKSEKNL